MANKKELPQNGSSFFLLIFKFFNKGANCVSAVAYLIFNFRVKFCGGAAIFRKIEIRVITKAVCSGAVFGYFAMEIAFGGKGFSVRINKNDRAGVMGFFVFFITNSYLYVIRYEEKVI